MQLDKDICRVIKYNINQKINTILSNPRKVIKLTPISTMESYFCIYCSRNKLECDECPYAEIHGICCNKGSDFWRIKQCIDLLKPTNNTCNILRIEKTILEILSRKYNNINDFMKSMIQVIVDWIYYGSINCDSKIEAINKVIDLYW